VAMPSCTISRTHACGWTWETHHRDFVRVQWVYSSRHTTDAAAEAQFAAEAGPLLGTPTLRHIRPGHRARRWVGNVAGVGGSTACLGPLHASRLDHLLVQTSVLAESLSEQGSISPLQRELVNRHHHQMFERLRGLLAVHLKLNDRMDTPYWKECQAIADLGSAGKILAFYQENGPTGVWERLLTDPADLFSLSWYMTAFLGLKVPFHRGREISQAEREAWAAVCAAHRAEALDGFTANEVLLALHSGRWVLT